jgi:hydroxypyruvate isomerase
MTRFSANVSMLFTERPFLERFAAAAAAGFSAVEFWWPSAERPSDVAAAVRDAGVAVAALNFDGGDMSAGDRGLLSDPARVDRFRSNIPIALELAGAIECQRLNALVGLALGPDTRAEQLSLARESVREAADAAVGHRATILIEALNPLDNGRYLLPTIAEASAFIDEVERDNVALLFDVFHVQRAEGNIVDTLRRHQHQIGHAQIADCPGRGEPGTGEIRFPFVLGALDEIGYDGFVGLEYRPTTRTEESLVWMESLR